MTTITTQYLDRSDGRISYDDNGIDGPLVIAAPGMGDTRHSYRHIRAGLAAAGIRFVTMDLRGVPEAVHGAIRFVVGLHVEGEDSRVIEQLYGWVDDLVVDVWDDPLVGPQLIAGPIALELAGRRKGGQVVVSIHDLDAGGNFQIRGGYVALALRRQIERLRLLGVDPKHDLLQIEDDVDNVLDDTFDRRELMLDAFNANGCDRRPGDPGKQRAPQGVPERISEAGLERFDHEPRPAVGDRLFFDIGALGDEHGWAPPGLWSGRWGYFEYSSTMSCS